jgi:hypothetical protein
MAVHKQKKTPHPYKVVNIFPETTPEERERSRKEIARRVYDVLVKSK